MVELYRPQPLLPSIPEMAQMGQQQEQMGLLREQRDLQRQQFEQQTKQQEMTNKFNTLKTLADIDENIAIDYAEKNFTDLGIDFPKYKEDKEAFKRDIMELDPLIQRGLKGDPEAIRGFTSKVREIQMKYPREAGKEQYKSLLSPKEQGFPSLERKFETVGDQAFEVQPGAEAGTQLLPVTPEAVKEYAPELKRWVKKGAKDRYIDMNKPLEVKQTQDEGFTEYVDPGTGRETPAEAAAKAAARITAGLKAWKSTFKDMMGRDPTKEEIRKKLINDPYGLLEPVGEETPQPIGTPPLSTLKEGTKTTYKDGSEWTLRNGKPVKLK